MMSPLARREYVWEMRSRYQAVGTRRERSRLLSQTSETLGCHRKHAIRVLKGRYWKEEKIRYREPKYPEKLIEILKVVWEAAQYPWSVRLKAALPLWLPKILERWELKPQEIEQLLEMSPATMDRRLAGHRKKLGRKIYGQTKPGRWLRQTIPIQTESWGVQEPGWTEVDTVSHSGPSAQGCFGSTFNEVDLMSGWTEPVAILGKSAADVTRAAEEARQAMPFDQKGLDSDNGEEFINYELDRWCHQHGIRRFRSRPYKKNDQAHIEQKNGTHVRRLIGWDRYDTREAVEAMNDLYRKEWRLLTNLFLPSVKIAQKIRVGSRIKRIYSVAATPLDRLLQSGQGDHAKLDELKVLRERLNPFVLAQEVDRKLKRIWGLASRTRIAAAPKSHVLAASPPRWPKLVLEYNPPTPLFVLGRNSDLQRIRKMWWRDRFFGTN